MLAGFSYSCTLQDRDVRLYLRCREVTTKTSSREEGTVQARPARLIVFSPSSRCERVQ